LSRKITIAIDGHSSTGKSTLAKNLAKALNYSYVDSGAMYRCVALYAMKNGFYNPKLNIKSLIHALPKIDITFNYIGETEKNNTYLNGENVEKEIRGLDVSNKVSEVAAIPEIRKHLVALQQAMGRNKGVVMDGRDIGTVVFPDAELKIFMTARPEVRAKRRFDEMQQKGQPGTLQEVLNNLQKRDNDDTNRDDSPLKVATGARELDNSDINQQQQFEIALAWAQQLISIDN
jgi:cytidylate kinase